jgi:hypothetical protein
LRWPDEPVLIQLYARSKRLSMLLFGDLFGTYGGELAPQNIYAKLVRIVLHVRVTGVMNVITAVDAAGKGETT